MATSGLRFCFGRMPSPLSSPSLYSRTSKAALHHHHHVHRLNSIKMANNQSLLSPTFMDNNNQRNIFRFDNLATDSYESKNSLSSSANQYLTNPLPSPVATSISLVLNDSDYGVQQQQSSSLSDPNHPFIYETNVYPIVGKRKLVGRNIEYYNLYGWEQLDNRYQQQQQQQIASMYFDDDNNNDENMVNNESSSSSMMMMMKNSEKSMQQQQQQQQQQSRTNNNKNHYQNGRMECSFCKNLQPELGINYRDHWLKDNQKRITCPKLRAYNCPKCNNGGGDFAHTFLYCPKNRQNLANGFEHRAVQQQQQRRFRNNISVSDTSNNHSMITNEPSSIWSWDYDSMSEKSNSTMTSVNTNNNVGGYYNRNQGDGGDGDLLMFANNHYDGYFSQFH
ncbi:uncharacterized protein LOC113795490 [Dermatophagoides pteronyssinus]|uniref:Nuclear transcription factor Y subunit alpha-like n=1 Tax=Dermatophagoides pteronyssinus TaxID=6956 RepID=A0A6P6Y859_DERPT|nr:nuclear transcription factor Y subunit alpha-like [Dermatophagoides pteronyssinus]